MQSRKVTCRFDTRVHKIRNKKKKKSITIKVQKSPECYHSRYSSDKHHNNTAHKQIPPLVIPRLVKKDLGRRCFMINRPFNCIALIKLDYARYGTSPSKQDKDASESQERHHACMGILSACGKLVVSRLFHVQELVNAKVAGYTAAKLGSGFKNPFRKEDWDLQRC